MYSKKQRKASRRYQETRKLFKRTRSVSLKSAGRQLIVPGLGMEIGMLAALMMRGTK